VVYGLMELEEYDELRRYFEPVYKEAQKTGKALKTSRPAVNALLKAKMDEAERRGIDFYVEVKTNLKHLKVEDWELCKLISNIVDFFVGFFKVLLYIVIFGIPVISVVAFFYWLLIGKKGLLIKLFKKLSK
jgi:hypothetical protein